MHPVHSHLHLQGSVSAGVQILQSFTLSAAAVEAQISREVTGRETLPLRNTAQRQKGEGAQVGVVDTQAQLAGCYAKG